MRPLLPLLALALAACTPAAAVVEQPVAEVRSKLVAISLPKDVLALFAIYGGGEAKQRTERQDAVYWTFTQDGTLIGTYEASVQPRGDKTELRQRFVDGDRPVTPVGDHVDATRLVRTTMPRVMEAVIRGALDGKRVTREELEPIFKSYIDAHPDEKAAISERIGRELAHKLR